tara:strand:- start:1432 stop:1596 length:165 start_codon:yes stop_codon:yes gene_type:complete
MWEVCIATIGKGKVKYVIYNEEKSVLDCNGVAGVAGSNPVAPTDDKLTFFQFGN